MAQNRQVELDPANSSSDEEEEEEGSSEEQEEGPESSSSSSQEDDKTSPPTPPVTKNPSSSKKPEPNRAPAVPGSSSSDESGSESDFDIKPISSKPMGDPSKVITKPRSKPSLRNSPPPAKPAAGVKRPVESESDSRRAKRKVSNGDDEANGAKKTSGDDPKKQLFQRLWSEDDEIVILKGMTDYRAKKGADPVADMNAFHEFIKKSLHIDVSKTQLSDKVRRLKKKYENNAGKEKKGKDRTFSKPHEQKAYELSKKIWGREGNMVDSSSTKINGTTDKKNQSSKPIKAAVSPKVERFLSPDVKEVANVHKEVPKMEVENSVPLSQSVQLNTSSADAPLGVERIIRDRLALIEGSKKMELDEKWKKLHVEEVELYLRRVELIREQTSLVLESLKSAAEH